MQWHDLFSGLTDLHSTVILWNPPRPPPCSCAIPPPPPPPPPPADFMPFRMVRVARGGDKDFVSRTFLRLFAVAILWSSFHCTVFFFERFLRILGNWRRGGSLDNFRPRKSAFPEMCDCSCLPLPTVRASFAKRPLGLVTFSFSADVSEEQDPDPLLWTSSINWLLLQAKGADSPFSLSIYSGSLSSSTYLIVLPLLIVYPFCNFVREVLSFPALP